MTGGTIASEMNGPGKTATVAIDPGPLVVMTRAVLAPRLLGATTTAGLLSTNIGVATTLNVGPMNSLRTDLNVAVKNLSASGMTVDEMTRTIVMMTDQPGILTVTQVGPVN